MRILNYALVFIFFLLFLMPVQSADIFNLTGQTANIVNTGLPTSLVGKQRMFCDQNYCYHIYTSCNTEGCTADLIYITKWLKNSTYPFATLLDSKTITTGTSIIPHSLTFDVMDVDNEKFYMVYSNFTKGLNRYWVYKNNLSVVADTTYPAKVVDMNEIALTENLDMIYTNESGSTAGLPRKINKLFYTVGYVNTTLISYFNRPFFINYVYIPETWEQWIFFSNATNVYLYRFNENGGFITYYTINTNPIVKKSDFTNSWKGYEATSSVYAYYQNNIVYFTIRQNNPNNNTWYVNAVNPTETKNQNSLILLGSGQNIDLSLYDSWVGNDTYWTENQTTAMSLYYDNSFNVDKWYILYAQHNATANKGGKDIMLLIPYTSCLCTDWVNSTQCGYDPNGFVTPNVLWQTRVCNPTGCGSVGQFVDCTETPQQVNYKHITPPCSVCQPKSTNAQALSQGYLIPAIDGSSSCSMSYPIPNDATNITSKVIISVSAEKTILGTTPNNSYTTIICNPLVTGNCLTNSYTCRNDANISYSKDYNSYTVGQTATASIGVSGVGLCTGSWGSIGYGWTRYWVNGQLCVGYDKICGGWRCTSVGTEYFEVQEKPDCTTNATTLFNCIYGCEETTGRCRSSALPTVSGDPLTYIFDLTSGTFSSTILILFAVMISGGSTVYGTIVTKKWQIGIVVGMCIGLFFLAIGWLPSWLGILWILSLGLLLMKAIFFKGD